MNVLVYVVDALRADHLSCYGYRRETTPTLDRLADEGVCFERCYTPATWTRPVAASLLSGLYPPAHGTRTRADTFDPPRKPLTSVFSQAGYETFGVTTMGNVSTDTGFATGFDRYDDLYLDDDIVAKRPNSTAKEQELDDDVDEIALPRAEDINDTVERWLERRDDDRPFFTFCWSIEPHEPYDPPEGYDMYRDSAYDGPIDGSTESLKHVETEADRQYLEALYDEEIRYQDDCVASLLDILDDSGELEETLVVVVGDHGEAFNEHGRLTHGHSPHEEVARVPWIVRPPADWETTRGQRVESLVSLVDVYPTLAAVTDCDVPAVGAPVSGTSVSGALRDDSVDGHERVFFETQAYEARSRFAGVRTDRWKYISIDPPETDVGNVLSKLSYVLDKGLLLDILRNPRYYWERYRYDETKLLYDLVADPAEQHNLYDQRSDVRTRLETALAEWERDCAAYWSSVDAPTTREDIDDRTEEQLRQLGYTE